MRNKMRTLRLAFAGLALLALGACTQAAETTTGKESGEINSLDGEVRADGSSTVFPISQGVAEEYKNRSPGVRVTVGISGTGGGFKKFCNGEIDISDASRPIKDSEKAACKEKGIDWIELGVAQDGLSIVVNKSNDFAKCLTTAELRSIWDTGSTLTNWNQVRGTFPSTDLKLFGPGTDSGTFDYFTEAINGKEKQSRTDYTASEDDNVLVQGVAGEKGALGYFGFAYYEENRSRLNLVGVDSGSGCVQPSEKTINDGTYKPLSRPLFIYVRTDSLGRAEVFDFVRFYLDQVAEPDFIKSTGYMPAPATALDQSRRAVQDASPGPATS